MCFDIGGLSNELDRRVVQSLSNKLDRRVVQSLSSELIVGLSNGMIIKQKSFVLKTVFIHGIACAFRWGVALVGDFLY